MMKRVLLLMLGVALCVPFALAQEPKEKTGPAPKQEEAEGKEKEKEKTPALDPVVGEIEALLRERKLEDGLAKGLEALKTLPKGESRTHVRVMSWVAARMLYLTEGTHEADFVKLTDEIVQNAAGDDVRQILPHMIPSYLLVGEIEKAKALAADLLKKVPAPDAKTLEEWQKQHPDEPNPDAGLREFLEFVIKLIAGPSFDLTDIAGNKVTLADYKGKVLLLDFWATWCGPCLEELPRLIKLYDDKHAEGLDILGLSVDRDAEALKKFVADKGIKWRTVMLDKDNPVLADYGIEAIPAQFLFDRSGRLRYAGIQGKIVLAAAEKLLAEKPAEPKPAEPAKAPAEQK